MRRNLKLAIIASGRTQRQLAREAHMHEDRLSEIVTGATDPREREAKALADLLGRPVYELLREEPARRSDSPGNNPDLDGGDDGDWECDQFWLAREFAVGPDDEDAS